MTEAEEKILRELMRLHKRLERIDGRLHSITMRLRDYRYVPKPSDRHIPKEESVP